LFTLPEKERKREYWIIPQSWRSWSQFVKYEWEINRSKRSISKRYRKWMGR
jgi:hypothetical protein